MAGTDVVRAVERSGQASSQYLAGQLARLSISTAEAHVLLHLRADRASSIGEVQRLFPRRSSTMTSVIDRLENKGLVDRELDPSDHRTFQLVLTAAGRVAAGKVIKIMTDFEVAIRSQVSEADLVGFFAVASAVDNASK